MYTDQHNNITLAGVVNNTDYLVIMTPVSGWDIFGSKYKFYSQIIQIIYLLLLLPLLIFHCLQ